MSYPDIVTGLATALRTIPGLNVLEYEPRTLAERRAMYFLLDSFTIQGDVTGAGSSVGAVIYRINCRLCVRWQDNAQAEQDMAALIGPVIRAVSPFLGGALTRGTARATDATAEYADIGGTGAVNYRVCNIYVTVTDKGSPV